MQIICCERSFGRDVTESCLECFQPPKDAEVNKAMPTRWFTYVKMIGVNRHRPNAIYRRVCACLVNDNGRSMRFILLIVCENIDLPTIAKSSKAFVELIQL
jgi:hypothetical protein